MGTIREQRAKVRKLRERVLAHARAGRRAPRLRRAYHRAKAELALLRRQARDAGPRKAVAWAKKQVGVTEQPPGSNRGPKIDQWELRAAGYTGYPWCGAFVHEALLQAGVDLPSGVVYTPTILAWARNRQHGLRIVNSPKPGDLVLMRFPGGNRDPVHHVALYVGNGRTIEGNTSSGNAGSQDNGGGVFLRTRPSSVIVAYVRPTFPRS
jgi:cell wall-associated NlpC family hydrolase